MKIAEKEPTKEHTFGLHRAEILGSLVSVLITWLLTGTLVWEAIGRLTTNPTDVDGRTMTFLAIIGVVVNIALMYTLGSHSHLHELGGGGHHDDHQGNDEDVEGGEQKQGSSGSSVNLRAAALNVLGDLFQVAFHSSRTNLFCWLSE